MDNRFRFVAAASLAIVLLGGSCLAGAADVSCMAEMPNPFAPVPVTAENMAARARHKLHLMRTTWVDHTKVYPEELDDALAATMGDIRANPSYYLDRVVTFDVYYGKQGNFFRPFVSPFDADGYVNVSAWPYGAELWTKEGRAQIHPLFYVAKTRLKVLETLNKLPMNTPLHLWASVRGRADNQAWIEILQIKIIPESTLTVSILRHLELGAMQLSKKRYELAAQAIEQALELDIPVTAQARAYNMLGHCYSEMRNYAVARNAFVNAVLRDDSSMDDLISLARCDLRMGKADEAKQAADRAILVEPASAPAHAELGLAIAMLGDPRGGYKELEFAQRLAPKGQLPEANRNRAMVALLEGKLMIARDELNQAVIFRPTDVDLKLELGDVYSGLSDFEKARLEFTQARDLSPARAEPYYKLAAMLKKQGDAAKADKKEDDAKKLYEEALENVKNAMQRNDQFTPAFGLQAELLRALGREEAPKAPEKPADAKPAAPVIELPTPVTPAK